MKIDYEVLNQQLHRMLQMQDQMNTRVHPEWRGQHNSWYRAIWTECAEMLEHYGWKWWKKQEPDLDQVKLELVDIWHFGLSSILERDVPIEDVISMLEELESDTIYEFRTNVENLAIDALVHWDFSVYTFAILMNSIGMTFDELYVQYVGKNILNFFRQDHGYKEGTYQKIWDGREDNEHLVEVVAALDSSSDTFPEQVYAQLKVRYSHLTTEEKSV